ncbi:MAG TPA: penicillin-binding protein 2 [Bacillales bacterium]|nr:penicillin-binding protein 2 [Bacillales bacterium]
MNNKKKKKKHVPFRLNIVFFIVFLLFSALILRLGVVQIVYGDDFKREIQRTEDVTVNNPVPRGKMYDRNGKIIVDNIPLNAITFTKNQNADPKEMLKVAENLSHLINVDISKIRERDRKDFWILKHPEKAKEKITKNEWKLYDEKKLDDKKIYKLQLERITNNEMNSFSPEELKVLAIYRQFNSGYALTPQIVKNKEVTPQEFAIVSENLDKLPGVDTTTDWERYYTFGKTLKTVLGNVTSSDEGLPKDQADQLLAQDYSRNDRVGKSYIEMEYEDVLHGDKAKVKNVTDKAGKVLSTEVISDGQRGKDLVLTIDMDLQLQVEKIIEEELWKAKQNSNSALLDRAFVVMMNPYTGEILSMAGKQIGKNEDTGKPEMNDFALGNITTSYNVGSAVKGATILTGYETGAIQPGSYQLDQPLKIKNTPVMKSWKTFGSINDLRALQVSSNVYMWKTVIAMAGGHYAPNQALPLNPDNFDTLRQSFSQFGLGSLTGIDLPNETMGYKGTEKKPGQQLFLAIGQYDTYTPMQLAQYVSTIANGGYRVQPHIVKEIREPVLNKNEMGPIVQEIAPKILNKISAKDEWIRRVQEGFRMVMQVGDGTAVSYFKGADYNPAGKTGTAQAFYDGPQRKKFGKIPPEVMNLSLVSFAPFDHPEVAMAVLVPWAYQGSTGPSTNNYIGRRVMDAYFNLKKERETANKNQTTTDQKTDSNNTNQTNQ